MIVPAMLAVALGAGSGCSDDFEPYTRLSTLRVLGISGDPAAPATGETTTLTPLVFKPTEEAVTYSWSWCPFAGSSRDGYPCLISEAELAPLLMGSPVPPYSLGDGETAVFTNSFPANALMQACLLSANNPFGGSCNKGFPILIRLEVTSPSKPEGIVTVKTLNLRFDAETEPNSNPQLTGITAVIGGVEVPITDDENPTVTLPRNKETEIRVGISEALVETYTLPPDPKAVPRQTERVAKREYLLVRWFVESGGIDEELTSFAFNEKGERVPESIDITRKNRWTPAKLEDYPGETARIVVVVRDSREGIGIIRGRVRLGDVQ